MKLKLNKSLKLDKLLKNKAVLFITFFLSLVTIFGYLVKQNYTAILFFTLVLFLTKHFSSNMIIILGVSIITTNLLDLFRVFSNKNLEGMEDGATGSNTKPDKQHTTDSKAKSHKQHTTDSNAKSHKQDAADNSEGTVEKMSVKKAEPKCDSKTGKCKSKSGMTNIKPAALSEVNNSGSGNMDVFNDAKMKETAFDNLDKLLGSDNVRNLKGEANSLTMRQDKIMEQIKDVGPLMNQAMSLIKNIDMDAINNVTNKMGGMIDNLQQMKTSN